MFDWLFKKRVVGLVLAVSISLLLLGTIFAAPLYNDPLTDPQFRTVGVKSSLPISDTRPTEGIAKTVYFNNSAPGVITLTFEISGTPTLTFAQGTAFNSPRRIITSSFSSFTETVTYTVNSSSGDFLGVNYQVTNVNGTQVTVPISYVRDLTAPTVSLLPLPAGVFTDTTLAVAGTAADNVGGSGVRQVSILTDTTWIPATGTANWFSSVTFPLIDGSTYTLSARADDYVGMQSLSASSMITVDNLVLNPQNVASAVSTGTWSQINLLPFSWTQVSDYSTPVRYYYALNTLAPYEITSGDSFTTTEEITLPVSSSGVYTFYIRTRDAVGNWAERTLAVGPFQVDTVEPSTWDAQIQVFGGSSPYLYVLGTQLYYTNTGESAFRVGGYAEDALSGMERISLSEALGSSPADITGGFLPWQSDLYVIDATDAESGVITATAHDQAGNTAVQTYTYELDASPPYTGNILIDSGAEYVTEREVSLDLFAADAGSGVAQMCINQTGEGCSAWETYEDAKVLELLGPDGLKTVYVWYQDHLGNISGSYTDTIFFDSEAPVGGITIVEGPHTSQPTVTLRLTATDSVSGSGVVEMRLRQSGETWKSWEAFVEERFWVLSGADGNKMVEVQYRDAAGNVSQVESAAVLLDRAAPMGEVTVAGGDYTNHLTVSLLLTATDSVSGSGVVKMRLRQEGEDWNEDDWEAFMTERSWTLPDEDGNKTVEVQYRDLVGHKSSVFSDSIFLDRVPPTVSLTVPIQVASGSIPVEWSAEDAVPSAGDLRYTISYREDEGSWVTWLTEVVSQSADFDEATLDHTYTFSVTVQDAANNAATATGTTEYKRFQVFIPLTMRNYAPFVNGDFENGLIGWKSAQAPLPVRIVEDTGDTDPSEGTRALLLGNPNYACNSVPVGFAAVEQTFTVPNDARKLIFDYIIWSQDASTGPNYDRFEVYINNTLEFDDGNKVNTGLGCGKWWRVPGSDNPRKGATSGWGQGEIDLRDYQGQTITLSFQNHSRYDNWYNTYTYIDNVRIVTE